MIAQRIIFPILALALVSFDARGEAATRLPDFKALMKEQGPAVVNVTNSVYSVPSCMLFPAVHATR